MFSTCATYLYRRKREQHRRSVRQSGQSEGKHYFIVARPDGQDDISAQPMIPMLQIKMAENEEPIQKGSLMFPPSFANNSKKAPMPYMRSYPPLTESQGLLPVDIFDNVEDNRATIHPAKNIVMERVNVKPKPFQPAKNDIDEYHIEE